MAVLTDIIVAPTTEVPAIIAEWPGAKRWPALDTSGLDLLVLADLASALNQPALAISIEEQSPSAAANEADGPWLYVLPTALRDRMVAVNSSEIPVIARAWSKGEEAANRGLTADVAERLLMEIHKLAVRARSENKPMLLWVSM